MEILIIFVIFLFLFFIILAYILGNKLGRMRVEKKLPEIIRAEREDSVKRSRAVLVGQFSEQLAPYFPDFPFSPTEIRFIGKPVDFIVFKGMDENKISEIIFVEVKSGNSKLSLQEKNLKEAIENKKVSWMEYKIRN